MAQNIMPESPPNVRNLREFLKYNGEYKICPLCQSHICLFLINFTDKMIMCENQFCDFPFGYEKPKVLKPGDQLDPGFSISIGVHKPPSEGVLDTSNTSDETEMPAPSRCPNKKKKKTNVTPVNDDEKIKKSIEDLARLNAELSLLNDETTEELKRYETENRKIKNEKWIKNLRNLQEMSGVQLLRPEELGLLKKEEPAFGLGELKIDIGSANVYDVPSIRIEIHNNVQDNHPGTSDGNTEGTDPLPES